MPPTTPTERAPIDRYDPANWALYVPPTRSNDYLKQAQKRLEDWRSTMWLSRYRTQPFGAEGILPNPILTSLATRTSYHTVEDVRALRWILAGQHAAEVLRLLESLDREVALAAMAEEKKCWDEEEAERQAQENKREQERIRKMIEAAKKHEETAARRLAEKERKARLKAAQKVGRDAVRAIAKRQKEAKENHERARKVTERVAAKAKKTVEQEAEKARKQAEKATKGKEQRGRKCKAKGEESGEELPLKRRRGGKENQPPGINNIHIGNAAQTGASIVAPAADVPPCPPPRPRPLK